MHYDPSGCQTTANSDNTNVTSFCDISSAFFISEEQNGVTIIN